MDAKTIAEQIFWTGVKSVLPDKLIKNHVFIRNSTLFISSFSFPLDSINRIFVIGAGKASALMASEVENILGDRITGGHLVVKYGHACDLKRIQVTEAGHPVPDHNGYLGTLKILEIADSANDKDLIICLISGGGSALLVDFPEGATLKDLLATNELLLKSGLNIKEINTVRKHLSKVKGGQLAKAAYPATVVSLILSDVIGDPLDVVASGPTVPDPSTFQDSIAILKKFKLLYKIPLSILNYLRKGIEGVVPETPKPGDPVFVSTQNSIIGNNKIALQAAYHKAIEFGLNPFIVSDELEGQVSEIAEQLVEAVKRFQNNMEIKKPCCILFGGESTLVVDGPGKGGRNQHLALAVASKINHLHGLTFLLAGTDGNDGPTSVAGAIVSNKTMDQGAALGIHAEKYLNEFDSFHFFKNVGGHIVTGPTMTNVMDLMIIIIE